MTACMSRSPFDGRTSPLCQSFQWVRFRRLGLGTLSVDSVDTQNSESCLFINLCEPGVRSRVRTPQLGSELERKVSLFLYISSPASRACTLTSSSSSARPSIPYGVRLRQCLVEYNAPNNESRRPLFNALKYASSFPVIFLSAAQRIVVSDTLALKGESAASQPWHGEHQLFRLWCVPLPLTPHSLLTRAAAHTHARTRARPAGSSLLQSTPSTRSGGT